MYWNEAQVLPSVQLAGKDGGPPLRLTVPVGAIGVPPPVSVTVTEQVVGWATDVALHEMDVEVGRVPVATGNPGAVEARWFKSPSYVAFIVCTAAPPGDGVYATEQLAVVADTGAREQV